MTENTQKRSLKTFIPTEVKTVVLSDGSKIVLEIKKMTIAEEMQRKKELLVKYPDMRNQDSEDFILANAELVVKFIKEWDFEEEISLEAFKLLPSDEIEKIVKIINNKDEASKKE